MGKIMKLIDIIKNIENFDDDLTIYAKKPWTVDSSAILCFEDEQNEQLTTNAHGFEYFLENFIVIETIEGWTNNIQFKPTDEDICMRLIEYAINDS